jgi:noranthrone synthase
MVLQQTVDKASRELAKTGTVSGKSTTSVSPLKPAPREVSKIVAEPTPQITSGTALAKTTSTITVAIPAPVNLSSVAAPSAPMSPPKPVATPPKKQELSPKFVNALAIIAEESGIAVSDLTDESNFADIGVDSLLSMVIGSRFREELNLELDSDFSIFVDVPTVNDLKVFLQSRDQPFSTEETPEAALPVVKIMKGAPSVAVTFYTPEPAVEQKSADVHVLSTVEEAPPRKIEEELAPAPTNGTANTALRIIADESGIAFSDLSDDSNFADIGVDSLLSSKHYLVVPLTKANTP